MRYYEILEEQACIVYLESIQKLSNKLFNISIDFRLSSDVNTFNNNIGADLSSSTYLELRNMRTTKRLMQGCYYQLNLNVLKDIPFNHYKHEDEDEDEDPGLFGGYFDLSEMEYHEDNNTEILQTHKPLDNNELRWVNQPEVPHISISSTNNMEIFIKDVGQANWNELSIDGDVKVLFDAGAELHATKVQAQTIFNSRRADLENSKPILVLSHWDMDHIHCLKYLDCADIRNCFSAMICPDSVKSITSRKIRLKIIRALGINKVYSLSSPARTNGITMNKWCNMGCLSIYIGESSKNINFCGLVMFVEGQTKTANYTGDCRLSQADNVYRQMIANEQKGHVLISPHHGGDYGAKYRHYFKPYEDIYLDIAISVSKNNMYGHPHNVMVKYLETLGNIVMTSDKNRGDIIFNI